MGITHCGAFAPLGTPGDGCWYDRPDAEAYAGLTPEFLIRPRVGVLVPNREVGARFQQALGEHAATTVLLATDDVDRAQKALEHFALDVIVIAPACANLLALLEVPPSWNAAAKKLTGSFAVTVPKKEHVFIEAKPIEVLSAIATKSWVGTRLGWLLSASFV